jgi:2-keto-4-pentenoate hydratase/2-oxohepta-3-ene-1,7-dioic acid hydratase in catechol pathway
MKLALISPPDEEQAYPSVVTDSTVITSVDDDTQFSRLLAQVLDEGPASTRAAVTSGTSVQYQLDDVSVAAPLAPDGRLFCIGGAYASHRRARDRSLLTVPHQWLAPDTSVVGPDSDIVLPAAVSENVMPAVELAVVIGKGGSYITEADAFDHIAGYTISNDVTARTDWPGPRGYKLFDTFSPCGPYVLTKDEIANPLDLRMELRQDGRVICDGTTAGHQFTISFLVSYLSTIHELRPGDVISTGDPGNVSEALEPGSRIDAEIEGIGTLSNNIVIQD